MGIMINVEPMVPRFLYCHPDESRDPGHYDVVPLVRAFLLPGFRVKPGMTSRESGRPLSWIRL